MSMMSKTMTILFLFSAYFVVTSRACPPLCECFSDDAHVHCNGQGQTSFPDNIPLNTTLLFLRNYSIDSLSPQNFENLVNLTELRLEDNGIAEISDNTFLHNANLVLLFLDKNKLKTLSERAFNGTTQMKALHLRHNPDLTVEEGTFQQLKNLRRLYLSNTSFPVSYNFEKMENLVELEMNNCNISSLSLEFFIGLSGLTDLKLDYNQLQDISFLSSLPMLESISIASNNISDIPSETFTSTQRLQKVTMDLNNIETLHPGLFSGLKNLSYGSFEQNHVERFTGDIFDVETDLTSTDFHFSVYLNPIHCDCKMKWLASTRIVGQCYQPKFVEGREFSIMEQTDYQCGPRSINRTELFKVLEGGSAVLQCPIIIDPPESASWETPVGSITESELPLSDQSGDVYILETGNLKVQNARKEHEGIYRCRLGNQLGHLSEGPLFLDVDENDSDNSVTVLALSISLAFVTLFVLFLLFFLLKKRFRGSGSSRYRFLLERSGEGTMAEI